MFSGTHAPINNLYSRDQHFYIHSRFTAFSPFSQSQIFTRYHLRSFGLPSAQRSGSTTWLKWKPCTPVHRENARSTRFSKGFRQCCKSRFLAVPPAPNILLVAHTYPIFWGCRLLAKQVGAAIGGQVPYYCISGGKQLHTIACEHTKI